MQTTKRRWRHLGILLSAILALAVLPVVAPDPAHAAEITTTVRHTDTTSTRGELNKTFYSGVWDSSTAIHWADVGSFFEIAFEGETLALFGTVRTTHGTAKVFVDDLEVGTINYRGTNNSTPRSLFTLSGLTPGRHVVRVDAQGWVAHAQAVFTAQEVVVPVDALEAALAAVAGLTEAEYTTGTWARFASARSVAEGLVADGGTAAQKNAATAELRAAAAALVMVKGLRDLVSDYQDRVPSDHTASSWAPFASALVAAQSTVSDAHATAAQIVSAKNGLLTAAAKLTTVGDGEFLPITNNTFWKDTSGNPIYSQGGGIFRYGDTYYWYGVRYKEAALYEANPSREYPSTFDGIPVYSSQDLVNWTFENDVATTSTAIKVPASNNSFFARMTSMAEASWVGRLGVSYNENTGKYVLLVQFCNPYDTDSRQGCGILFLQGDSPTDTFDYANLQMQVQGSPTNMTGDQTVFTDEDGSDYLVFSSRFGRVNAYVSKISSSDSLTVEPAVRIGYEAAGREGNAMFRLGDRYYMAASDLHGWDTSVNYVVKSLTADIQGSYSPWYVMPGTEKDYSHVSQTGFFVTINGTKQQTVLYAGDRWSDFAWNGLGYNQWVPLSEEDGDVRFNSLSNWELNATTGEWRIGQANNFVLNPDFDADRIAVTSLTGWTKSADPGSPTSAFVSNASPGAIGQYALRLGATSAFAGKIAQEIDVPEGVYRLAASRNTAAGFDHARIVITDAFGARHELDINQATQGWAVAEQRDIVLPAGTATVSIEAKASQPGRSVLVDTISLVREHVDKGPLSDSISGNSGRDSTRFTAATWAPFQEALDAANALLVSTTASQSVVDAARTQLDAAADALRPAVTAIDVTSTRTVYGVGESFDAGTLMVTATLADGTRTPLAPPQVTFTGYSSAAPGATRVTVTVDPQLLAVGAPSLVGRVDLTVVATWNSASVYLAGAEVLHASALWRASWWTQNQRPGDPYGPWQEIRSTADGTIVWTASRIFVGGETVVHSGVRYVAKWWTRNQAPGDPNGPWRRQG